MCVCLARSLLLGALSLACGICRWALLLSSCVAPTGENGNKLSGETTLAGQPFEVIASAGFLTFTNTGGDQPIICDAGFSVNAVGGDSSAVGADSETEAFAGWGKAAIGVVFVLVAAIAGCRVTTYTHYPTISTDMLSVVRVQILDEMGLYKSLFK